MMINIVCMSINGRARQIMDWISILYYSIKVKLYKEFMSLRILIHFFGSEFLDRKFAVMIEGSWLPIPFLQSQPEKNFEDTIGFIPSLPVPYKNNETSTLMGGWALCIPKTSIHKDRNVRCHMFII